MSATGQPERYSRSTPKATTKRALVYYWLMASACSVVVAIMFWAVHQAQRTGELWLPRRAGSLLIRQADNPNAYAHALNVLRLGNWALLACAVALLISVIRDSWRNLHKPR